MEAAQASQPSVETNSLCLVALRGAPQELQRGERGCGRFGGRCRRREGRGGGGRRIADVRYACLTDLRTRDSE